MIVSFILYLVYLFVYGITSVLRVLPDVSLPASMTTSLASVGGYLAAIQTILPVDTILSVLAAVLSIEAFVFLYKIIMWIIRRIPTQS